MDQSRRYLPTLDGWRALSILAVMFYHLPAVSIFGHSLRSLQDLGQHGVTTFFVISGFLICTRLLYEERNAGSISLKTFYTRRLFRIQPAALLYLLAVAALSGIGVIPFKAGAWWTALLACRNYYPHALWDQPGAVYTNHFWSLGVEEHFYLILPMLLVLTRPGMKRLQLMGGLSLLSFIWARIGGHMHLMSAHTDLSFELLIIPTLVAAALQESERFRSFLSGTKLLVAAMALGSLLSVQALVFKRPLSIPLCLFFLMACVFGTSLTPGFFVSRLLETAVFRFVGRISYSLYLWQQLFLVKPAESFAHGILHNLQDVRIGWLMAFTMAILSYYFIETPFIRWGHAKTKAKQTRQHPSALSVA